MEPVTRARNNGIQIGAVVLSNGLLRLANNGTTALIGFYFVWLRDNGITNEKFLFLSFAINALLLGLLNVIVNVFEMLGAVPFGLLIDKYSPRKVMIGGALLGAMATLMFNWGGGLIVIFFISRMLEGLSAASIGPGLLSSLADLTEGNSAKRSRVMSMFEVSLLIGLAAGTFVGGVVWDWLSTHGFSLMAGCYLLVAVLAFFVNTESATSSETAEGSDAPPKPQLSVRKRVRFVFVHPSFRYFGTSWLILNAIVGMWVIQSPFLLTDKHIPGQFLTGLYTPTEAGYLLLGYATLFAAGAVCWAFVIPNRSKLKVMRLTLFGLISMCGFLFLINSSEGWPGWLITALGIGAGLSVFIEAGFTPAALTYLADLADKSKQTGVMMGAYSMLMGMGNAIGSFLGGWLASTMAINGLILGTLVLAIIAILALFSGLSEEGEQASEKKRGAKISVSPPAHE